jgi:hypothetical protein
VKYSHLCLVFPSGFFPLGFSINVLYAFLSHEWYVLFPPHLPYFDFPRSMMFIRDQLLRRTKGYRMQQPEGM